MLEPGAAKEQVAKTAADLHRVVAVRIESGSSTFIRGEIAEQMKAIGCGARSTELDAVKKRVRELERAAGMTASGRARRLEGHRPASRTDREAHDRQAHDRQEDPAEDHVDHRDDGHGVDQPTTTADDHDDREPASDA